MKWTNLNPILSRKKRDMETICRQPFHNHLGKPMNLGASKNEIRMRIWIFLIQPISLQLLTATLNVEIDQAEAMIEIQSTSLLKITEEGIQRKLGSYWRTRIWTRAVQAEGSDARKCLLQSSWGIITRDHTEGILMKMSEESMVTSKNQNKSSEENRTHLRTTKVDSYRHGFRPNE